GHRAEPLVLHPRLGDHHPGQEPERGGADREPERVLLGDAHGPAGLAARLVGVGRRVGHPVGRAGDLLLHRLHLAVDVLLGATLDVGLVAEGVDRVAHLLARVLYLLPDRARVLIHLTSSFTVSTVCSGTGGPASRRSPRPRRARTPAIAP